MEKFLFIRVLLTFFIHYSKGSIFYNCTKIYVIRVMFLEDVIKEEECSMLVCYIVSMYLYNL